MTLTAMDAMATAFETEYEALEELSFGEQAVSAKAFVGALCRRRGVVADLEGLEDILLETAPPEGCTERQILGMIAGIYGANALIDRDGVLRFRWYAATDKEVTADGYYADGLTQAGFNFTVGWLRCYNDTMAETLLEGDGEAQQGIYFECPWMTEDRLAALWARLGGFRYRPAEELRFMGDPRLDAGDLIKLKDLAGDIYSVPVMSVTHEYDGGLMTSVSAKGQAKTDGYEGPVIRETKRTLAKIVKKAESIESSVLKVEQDADGKYSELSSRVEQNASAVEMAFSEIREQVDANTAGREEVQVHIRFGADGITMGRTDSAMTQQLSHDRNVFRSSGEEVSGTDAYKHWAKRIEGTESGQMANLEFKRRSNGNAVIRYKRR